MFSCEKEKIVNYETYFKDKSDSIFNESDPQEFIKTVINSSDSAFNIISKKSLISSYYNDDATLHEEFCKEISRHIYDDIEFKGLLMYDIYQPRDSIDISFICNLSAGKYVHFYMYDIDIEYLYEDLKYSDNKTEIDILFLRSYERYLNSKNESVLLEDELPYYLRHEF
jgi:hypothetical protein